MQAARQVGNGLLYALISVILVVGGLSLALAEGNNNSLSPTLTPSSTANSQTLPPTSLTSTPLVQVVVTATPLIIPSPTQTVSALVNCIPPSGWILIIVQPGDSFSSLAERYQISPEQLEQANCLAAQSLPAGYDIYVPLPQSAQRYPADRFPDGSAVMSSSREIRFTTSLRCTGFLWAVWNAPTANHIRTSFLQGKDCGCQIFQGSSHRELHISPFSIHPPNSPPSH